MNREIKFRGISCDHGGWTYGSLIKDGDNYYIAWTFPKYASSGFEKVKPETIGQYTGLKDNESSN